MSRISQKICNSPERINLSALNIKEKSALKNEIVNPEEQKVLHRKSERRRVARDIFLVFEEQRCSYRSRANKKQARLKPKFGHLKVENFNKTKSLLRDVKNEPKCLRTAMQKKGKTKPFLSTKEIVTIANKSKNDCTAPSPTSCDGVNTGARVNPIFLWVKQDDTRIVEVRCEDYDKRNRIRITKTSNGWRAIPRTDPSSSRIVKFLQTPLLKVKREAYLNQIQEQCTNICTSSAMNHQLEPESDASAVAAVNKVKEPQVDCSTHAQSTSKNRKRKQRGREKNIWRKKRSSSNSCYSTDVLMEKLDLKNSQDVKTLLYPSEIPYISPEIDKINNALINTNYIVNEERKTYQMQDSYTPELQLCPKTGLFLPSQDNQMDISVGCETICMAKDIVDLADCEIEYNKQQEMTLDDIDVETKNLKDLLEEADLLQHCGDNANSGTELIDSLVKRSCEDNLIQETNVLKDNDVLNAAFIALDQTNMTEKHLIVEVIPQLSEVVTEPPKCLSFNEAGEIEGLNGELFQSNNYSDTFDKEPVIEIDFNCKPDTGANTALTLECSPVLAHIAEDAPKDLSNKKREEVCPSTESRSQCAVTSSSDVVKPPVQNEIPTIESTSETIKNLILEQFIKLNKFNTASESTAKSQQSEPIDLGKNKHGSAENNPTTSNYIETVVIDDASDDEPVKKRLRNTNNNASLEETHTTSIMDQDPDPLTQLQLLIKNTQWKVPDPILVPKDRLGAVLASPAREIPLLITTRPELRLPEAFAHPEIIKNPNILVISMAQLEAILKNDVELDKNKPPLDSIRRDNVAFKTNQKHDNEMYNRKKVQLPPSVERKCSHVDSNLASDINAATLAVFNQMLWIPYFGQLSQEFFKSLKSPVNDKTYALPFYNPQIGLQHLDELYKNYVKQLSQIKTNNQTHVYPNGLDTLQNSVELAIFQKIIGNQMHNYFNMAKFPAEQEPLSVINQSSNELTLNTISHLPNINSIDQKRTRKSQIKTNSLLFEIPDSNSNIELPKSLCLNNLKESAGCELVEHFEMKKFSDTQKSAAENRPRLTCKSLSNLLEPENIASAAVPAPLATFTLDRKHMDINVKSIIQGSESSSTFKAKSDKVKAILSSFDVSTQRKGNFNFIEPEIPETSVKNVDALNTSDSNPALWHPLFGSNTKPGYSSPWQWTTVTATGE